MPRLTPLKATLCFTALATSLSGCMHENNKPAQVNDPMAHADADMKRVLDAQATLHPKPIETLTPAEARMQPSPADGAKLVMQQEGKNPNDPMGVKTKDMTLADNIKARIYTPAHSHGKLPVVVYYHGGGWVIADLSTYDATPRAIAKQTGAIVVSVEYRHAPENKFPAAHDDAFAAYKWVVQHADRFGGDKKRVAVMGESAGGNLAIDTSIAARDHGVQMPVYEVLVYPVAGVDMNTPSYMENANAKPLNKAMMGWFVKYTIKDDSDKQDPRLDIVGKANLQGLPSTTVITAQIDPLRSEGEALAGKLRAAGVEVDAKTFSGVTHEFFGMGAVVSKAQEAEALASNDLKNAFNQH